MRAGAALMLLAVASLASGCAHLRADDPWFGRDKLAHFAVSGSIAAGAAHWAVQEGRSDRQARAWALGWVVMIGAGKEAYDAGFKSKGYWSWKDMIWNLLGGLAGGAAVTAARD